MVAATGRQYLEGLLTQIKHCCNLVQKIALWAAQCPQLTRNSAFCPLHKGNTVCLTDDVRKEYILSLVAECIISFYSGNFETQKQNPVNVFPFVVMA